MLSKAGRAVLSTFLLAGIVAVSTQAEVDTSEYGAWTDVLTSVQAEGRFEWLKRCHKGILVETWERMYDPSILIPEDEKIEQLRQAWLFANGVRKNHPNYLTFGDANHQNPKSWQAGTSRNEECRSIPIDYSAVGLLTSFDFKQHCGIRSQDAEYEWIRKVEFGDFASESGAATYTYFSGRVIKAIAGLEYDLKLTPGFSEDPFRETWTVWIDWNNDGDFYDAGEAVLNTASKTTVEGKIVIPEAAVRGFSKMRITMDLLGGKDDPCKNTQYGEVEDYVLLIK